MTICSDCVHSVKNNYAMVCKATRVQFTNHNKNDLQFMSCRFVNFNGKCEKFEAKPIEGKPITEPLLVRIWNRVTR